MRSEFDVARAVAVADAATERAAAVGDGRRCGTRRTIAANLRLHAGECSADELERLARAALPLLEALGDDDGLFHVWHALGWVANMHSHQDDWADALEQALLHARSAGHHVRGSLFLSVPLAMGPRPASAALAKLDSLIGEPAHPADLVMRAVLLAMLGQIDEAWAVAVPATERGRELGLGSGGIWLAEIALIAGDQQAAAEYLESGCEDMERRGATAQLSTYLPQLGRVLCALDRPDEAERFAHRGRELGDPDDVWTQALWRQALALVHSTRGQHAEAVRLAEEAVEWFSLTDSLLRQGDALCDLAQVLESGGRRDEAIEAWREALDRYERKEITPLARRVRQRLAALEATLA